MNTDKKFCPLIRKKCLESDCMFYVNELEIQKGIFKPQITKIKIQNDCSIKIIALGFWELPFPVLEMIPEE